MMFLTRKDLLSATDLWKDFNYILDDFAIDVKMKTSKFTEDEKGYKIKISLAGIGRENISLLFEDKEGDPEILIEWKNGEKKDKQSFGIPKGDKDKISATYVDGILEVIVPKKEGSTTSFPIKIS